MNECGRAAGYLPHGVKPVAKLHPACHPALKNMRATQDQLRPPKHHADLRKDPPCRPLIQEPNETTI
jgi:hypothetical protein